MALKAARRRANELDQPPPGMLSHRSSAVVHLRSANSAFSRLPSAHGIREDVPCRAVTLWSAMDWLSIDRPPSQAYLRHLHG